jgi:hypothetical protein
MHLILAGVIGLGLLAPNPPTQETHGTSVVDENTLKRLATQSLLAQGLSEHNLPNELWPVLVDRTTEAFRWRHRFLALESELKDLRQQADELRRFVEDHEQFGDDFASYRGVVVETQRLTSAQQAIKRQQKQFERNRRQEEARAKQKADAAAKKVIKEANQKMAKLGFSPIGNDVFLSKSAYAYPSQTVSDQKVYFQPGPSGEMQPMTSIGSREEIDYTKMTISGSLLNGATITRNIGVAFVFRDQHGNQIGQETVIIENARPDVPYPFTGELVMASDQPFSSMTSWVLFADTAPPASVTTPANQPVPSTPASP